MDVQDSHLGGQFMQSFFFLSFRQADNGLLALNRAVHPLFVGLLCLLLSVMVWPARADVCQAPFMHDNGRLLLTGTGLFKMGADLTFSEVEKTADNRCEARIRGNTSVAFLGLPANDSDLDYWVRIHNGQASFQGIGSNGKRQPVKGQFDLRLLGLFAYGEQVSQEGQTFAPHAYAIQVNKKDPDAAPLVVRTGQKTVGSLDTIATAAGEQACWPVRYSREIEPLQVSVGGVKLPLPGMKSSVTDWFCPKLNMVMKQESVQAGVSSVVEVTGLH